MTISAIWNRACSRRPVGAHTEYHFLPEAAARRLDRGLLFVRQPAARQAVPPAGGTRFTTTPTTRRRFRCQDGHHEPKTVVAASCRLWFRVSWCFPPSPRLRSSGKGVRLRAKGFSSPKLEALRADLAARGTKALLVIRNVPDRL